MIGLPEVVQSQILSSYCDGKSISTYFHVIHCNKSLNEITFNLIRDALVDRYQNLANCPQFTNHDEVKDVLDIIREDIRTCKVIQSSDNRLFVDDGDASLKEGIVTKISEYCIIIDYFDKMRNRKSDEKGTGMIGGEFIMWCGKLQTQGGVMQRATLFSRDWSVTALDYFYDQLELNNQYLTHPVTLQNFFFLHLFELPFGFLEVELESDLEMLKRTRFSLSDDPDSLRYFLVPSQMEYEPRFALSAGSLQNRLLCYWDGEDEGDFEYSLSRLSENAKRILERLEY